MPGAAVFFFYWLCAYKKNYPAVYAVDAHRAFTYDAANIRNFFA